MGKFTVGFREITVKDWLMFLCRLAFLTAIGYMLQECTECAATCAESMAGTEVAHQWEETDPDSYRPADGDWIQHTSPSSRLRKPELLSEARFYPQSVVPGMIDEDALALKNISPRRSLLCIYRL